MKIQTTPFRKMNLLNVIRQMGYHPIHDYHSASDSWVRPLGRSHYPRFHMHVTESATAIEFDVHLDQQEQRMKIKGLGRHGSEGDSMAVQDECARLQRWIQHLHS